MIDKWITIASTDWDLVNVQAYLSVFISILSASSIFYLAYAIWHLAAARIPAPITSLSTTLTTVGEALDAVVLLKANIFTLRHVSLLVQCLIVVCCKYSLGSYRQILNTSQHNRCSKGCQRHTGDQGRQLPS